MDRPLVLRIDVSSTAEQQPCERRSGAIRALQPASPGQIAIELEKLRAVFGYEAGAWATASGEMMDALADLPGDLLAMARAEYIRAATQETRFPRPGTLRALVRDELRRRREAAYPAPVYVPPPERRQPTVEEIAKVDEMVKKLRGVASELPIADPVQT